MPRRQKPPHRRRPQQQLLPRLLPLLQVLLLPLTLQQLPIYTPLMVMMMSMAVIHQLDTMLVAMITTMLATTLRQQWLSPYQMTQWQLSSQLICLQPCTLITWNAGLAMGKIHKTVLIMDDKSRVKVTKNLAKLKLENERTKMEHMISSRNAFLQNWSFRIFENLFL